MPSSRVITRKGVPSPVATLVRAASSCRRLVSCVDGFATMSIVCSMSTLDSPLGLKDLILLTLPFSKRVFLVAVILRAAPKATVSTEKFSGSEIAFCKSSIRLPIAATLAGFLLSLPCS